MRYSGYDFGKAPRDQKRGFLPVVNRSVSVCVPLEDIMYIEKDSRVITVVTREQSLRYYEKMESVLAMLDGHFYQSLKSMVVNLRNILEMKDQHIRFVNGDSIKMSYKAYCRTRQVYSNYIMNGRQGFVHWREEDSGDGNR